MDIKTIYTAVMDILSEIYHDHLERLERVGVLEHLFLVAWFSIMVGGIALILFVAVVWTVWSLHDWWYAVDDEAAVAEELVAAQVVDRWMPPVARAAGIPAEDQLGVAYRRRRAAGT
jgi:hypothetical protein